MIQRYSDRSGIYHTIDCYRWSPIVICIDRRRYIKPLSIDDFGLAFMWRVSRRVCCSARGKLCPCLGRNNHFPATPSETQRLISVGGIMSEEPEAQVT